MLIFIFKSETLHTYLWNITPFLNGFYQAISHLNVAIRCNLGELKIKNPCKVLNYKGVSINRCEPEGTRTPNLLVRSQMLYPIKLQVLFVIFWSVAIRQLADN